jgi:hypothetical protein
MAPAAGAIYFLGDASPEEPRPLNHDGSVLVVCSPELEDRLLGEGITFLTPADFGIAAWSDDVEEEAFEMLAVRLSSDPELRRLILEIVGNEASADDLLRAIAANIATSTLHPMLLGARLYQRVVGEDDREVVVRCGGGAFCAGIQIAHASRDRGILNPFPWDVARRLPVVVRELIHHSRGAWSSPARPDPGWQGRRIVYFQTASNRGTQLSGTLRLLEDRGYGILRVGVGSGSGIEEPSPAAGLLGQWAHASVVRTLLTAAWKVWRIAGGWRSASATGYLENRAVNASLYLSGTRAVIRALWSYLVFQRLAATDEPLVGLFNSDSHLVTKIGAIALRDAGIAAVNIDHGFRFDGRQTDTQFYSHIAVANPFHRDLMKARAVASKIIVTGAPVHDALAAVEPLNDGAATLEGGAENELVLYCSSPVRRTNTRSARNRMLDHVCHAFEPPVRVVVKTHPQEDRTTVERLIHEWERPEVVLAPGDADLFSLIQEARVLVTPFSTTAIEAVLLGTPVVILNYGFNRDYLDFEAAGVGVSVPDRGPQGIVQAVRRAGELKGTETFATARRLFVERYAYRMDGRAANRVADLIENILRGTGP